MKVMHLDRVQATSWMDQASSGDDAAFAHLAIACGDDLYRLALAQGLTTADAAEAAQETLLRAYSGRWRWRVGGDAVAWLRGIALNVAREFFRRRRRLVHLPDWIAGQQADPATPDGQSDVDLQRLAAALARLPTRQREAVACRFLRRMSVDETAQAMGCAPGTVKAAVFAGLANLRKTLASDEH
jgi:RNA polymerase sigma factor (sigma-70 family)